MSAVFCDGFSQNFFYFEHFFRFDLDIGSLPTESTSGNEGLVDHDFTVGKGESFSFGSSAQKYGSHRGCQTYSDGGDVAFYVFHRVVECESTVNFSAGAVDVHGDIFARVLFFEEEDLSDDGVDEA